MLGPLDLGELTYHPLASTLRGCDHYLVALGRDRAGGLLVRDPEGAVLVRVADSVLRRAWANRDVPEGRGAFTLRRMLITDAPGTELERLLDRLALFALDNLVAAARKPGGGADAYLALLELPTTSTYQRSLTLLLPSAGLRYRAAAQLARTVLSQASSRSSAKQWLRVADLLDHQAVALARIHRDVVDGGVTSPSALTETAKREASLAEHADALREAERE